MVKYLEMPSSFGKIMNYIISAELLRMVGAHMGSWHLDKLSASMQISEQTKLKQVETMIYWLALN